jgi:hypothetical protein
MKSNVIRIGIAFGLIISSSFAQSNSLPITFEAPKSWTLLESKNQRGATYFLYEIGNNQNKQSKTIPSNALITIYKVPANESFADADAIVGSKLKNATAIVAGQDGESWKTYIYVTYEGKQQLIILYGIGMINGYGAEAMISFPHVAVRDNKVFKILTLDSSNTKSESGVGLLCNPSSVTEMVNQFNEFCSKLKISGRTTFASRVKLIDPPPGGKYYRKVN